MKDDTPASQQRSERMRRVGAGVLTFVVAVIGAVLARLGSLPLPWLLGVLFNITVILTLLSLLHLMAAVAVVSILVGACGALLLMRMTGMAKTTAFFATVPGGVAEMVNIAPRYG